MAFLNAEPKILILAFIGGIIPSLLWLWFWLKEEERPEPKGLLSFIFILGMLGVMVALALEKYIAAHVASHDAEIVLWASVEELIKYLAVLAVVYKTSNTHEPIDWPIFLLTSALGFAALENVLFLIKPLEVSGAIVGLLTGELRFLGSTLLHTVSSGTIGIAIGISFYMNGYAKKIFLFMGFVCAIALHSAFNFFIMRNGGTDFLKVFALLWVATIIILLLFRKNQANVRKLIITLTGKNYGK